MLHIFRDVTLPKDGAIEEGPEYEVIDNVKVMTKAKEEFALMECPAYAPTTTGGGGVSDGGGLYDTVS